MQYLSFLICNFGVVIPGRPGTEQLGETTQEKELMMPYMRWGD